MAVSFHSSRTIDIYPFLCKSFLELSLRDYREIIRGKNFLIWEYGVIDDIIVCCAAIFLGRVIGKRTKMGLFCVDPSFRGKKIGTEFYNHLIHKYKILEWRATTKESISFYHSVGAVQYDKKDVYTFFHS
jgi:GNAT superfamily N-acetyltransferase